MSIQTVYWQITLGAHFLTLAVIVAWNTWLAPSEHYPVAIILTILLLPLLLILKGLLNHHRKSYIWLSFISLFYFTIGVGDAYSDPVDRLYGYILIATSLTMFISSILYLRAPIKHKPT